MVEATGPQLPPPTAPQKTNPWIIVIAVTVLVCCSCFGAIGLLIAFGEPILHELGLYALLPVLKILL
jgi:hypothetical protein